MCAGCMLRHSDTLISRQAERCVDVLWLTVAVVEQNARRSHKKVLMRAHMLVHEILPHAKLRRIGHSRHLSSSPKTEAGNHSGSYGWEISD